MKKLTKKQRKIILIIYFILWYLLIIPYGISEMKLVFIFNDNIFDIIVEIIKYIIFIIITPLIFNIPLFIYLGAKKIAKKRFNKDKLSEADFRQEKEYYRDVLQIESPISLSYIDDFELKFPKDIVTVLLHLKLKGAIEITDDKIIKNESFNEKLSSAEQYILNCIQHGKVRQLDEKTLKSCLISDARKSNLLVDIKENLMMVMCKKVFNLIVIYILIYFISGIYGKIFGLNIYEAEPPTNILEFVRNFIYVWLILAKYLYPFFSIPYLFSYAKKRRLNPYSRTEEGNIIHAKLDGLKNFLKEYSMLNKRAPEELVMWQEYLVYSVMFNQNSKIISEYSKFIGKTQE